MAPETQRTKAFIYRFIELRQVPAKEVKVLVRFRAQRVWAWSLGESGGEGASSVGPRPLWGGISILAPRIFRVEASGLPAGPYLSLDCDLE